MASSTGTGAGVFQTSPTITTPTIDTITSAASTALTLKSAGTTALTIDTSQNVGIGTTPYTKLQVTGTIKVATGNAQGILSLGDGAGSAVNCGIYRGAAVGPTTDGNFLNIGGYDGIVFTTGNSVVASQTERMRIDQNGNVLVNYTSLPSPFYGTILVRNVGATAGKYWQTGPYTNNNYQLYNNSNVGQYMVDGATSWTTSSDARLKNITGTYANALSDIAQIQPVKFTWKADESNTPQVGVIAQSVENIVPEAISRTQCIPDDETEYLGVRYTELIPLMIASIQELKAMVDSIQSEFDAYKATHP
jgi:hypothetical protein